MDQKYCLDLVQYKSFFLEKGGEVMEQYRIILYWKKIEGYKNCGFKNNRDPRKHGRMHEL